MLAWIRIRVHASHARISVQLQQCSIMRINIPSNRDMLVIDLLMPFDIKLEH